MARETLRPSEMRRAAREARRDKQSGLTLADLRARQDALKAATPTYTNPNQAPLERTDDQARQDAIRRQLEKQESPVDPSDFLARDAQAIDAFEDETGVTVYTRNQIGQGIKYFGSKEHKPSRDLSQRIIDAEAKKNKLDLSD